MLANNADDPDPDFCGGGIIGTGLPVLAYRPPFGRSGGGIIGTGLPVLAMLGTAV
ncbi:MAG TPA: hypothetical protein VKB26_06635 [Candidatus Acidoferrales bacterium]|nr:hypothetical protein [Candidatus Acidoferrales bacterium]